MVPVGSSAGRQSPRFLLSVARAMNIQLQFSCINRAGGVCDRASKGSRLAAARLSGEVEIASRIGDVG